MSLVDRIMTNHRFALGVKRYHSWPTLQKQTVADHTCQVMRIYWELFGPEVPSYVWSYILWHDATEMYTGDIPFPVKRDNPELKEAVDIIEQKARIRMSLPLSFNLHSQEFRQIKLCDLLEMWEFGRVDLRMGNELASPIVTRTAWAASKLAEEMGVVDKINKWMEGQL